MTEKEMIDRGVAPLPRDTSRFKRESPDRPAVLRKDPIKALKVLSTYELVNLKDQTSIEA